MLHRYVMWRRRQQDKSGKAGQFRFFPARKGYFPISPLGRTLRLATQLEIEYNKSINQSPKRRTTEASPGQIPLNY